MPVVPITPGSAPSAGATMPSETSLLMALADMHKQGRFAQGNTKSNVVKLPQKSKATK